MSTRWGMELVVVARMSKSGNYNVFGVIWVLPTFPNTITVPGHVPIFWIDIHMICLMPQGLLTASFLACYFREGMLGIVGLKMTKIVLNQNTLAIAVRMEHSITTRVITELILVTLGPTTPHER
jgi:hypothetical protein